MRARERQKGFSLMEMMVAVAIIGIMAAITMTAVQGIRPRAQASSTAADIVMLLNTARQRAITENTTFWFGYGPPIENEGVTLGLYKDWNGNFDPDVAAAMELDEIRAAAAADAETIGCGGAGQLACRVDALEYIRSYPVQVQALPSSRFMEWDAGCEVCGRTPAGVVECASCVPEAFRLGKASVAELAPDGCSFCVGATGMGWIRFLPRGEVEVWDPAGALTAPGAAIVLGIQDEDETQTVHLISLTEPFGLTRGFKQ